MVSATIAKSAILVAAGFRGDSQPAAARGHPMITHLKFAGIPVKDQDKALKFWTELMGFKVMTDQPMGPGQRWIELGVGSGPTFLVLFTPEGHEDRMRR